MRFPFSWVSSWQVDWRSSSSVTVSPSYVSYTPATQPHGSTRLVSPRRMRISMLRLRGAAIRFNPARDKSMASEVLSYIAWSVAIAAAALLGLRLFWRTVGYYKVRKAGPRPLFGVRHRLWSDPGRRRSPGHDGGPGRTVARRRRRRIGSSRNTPPDRSRACRCSTPTGAGGASSGDTRSRARPSRFGSRGRCGYFAEITHLCASGTHRGGRDADARGLLPRRGRAASWTGGSSSTIRT